MRSDHQKRVDAFMRLAQQDVLDKPAIPSAEIRKLRCKLILEEALETIDALGYEVLIDKEFTLMSSDFDTDFICFVDNEKGPDLVEIADGCADIKVVTTGTLSACGIDDEELQVMVDENNLEKFGPGGHRRDDGKWVKPPNHQPPDIKSVLKKQSGD